MEIHNIGKSNFGVILGVAPIWPTVRYASANVVGS